jgi:hypothetical protein
MKVSANSKIKHSLPQMSIQLNSSISPRSFLLSIGDLARVDQSLASVKIEIDFLLQDHDVVAFEPNDSGPHVDLAVLLSASPDFVGRIQVQVNASEWKDDWPTRHEYLRQARRVVTPLLKRFNELSQTAFKLTTSRKRKKKKLSEEALVRFRRFALWKHVSHPLDWERFYRFIRYCHAHQIKLHSSQFESLLIEAGFVDTEARVLANVYEHCRAVLRV